MTIFLRPRQNDVNGRPTTANAARGVVHSQSAVALYLVDLLVLPPFLVTVFVFVIARVRPFRFLGLRQLGHLTPRCLVTVRDGESLTVAIDPTTPRRLETARAAEKRVVRPPTERRVLVVPSVPTGRVRDRPPGERDVGGGFRIRK